MKNYQKGSFRGDRGDRGGRSSFKPAFKSRGDERVRDMKGPREVSTHKAVCSDCSKSCDVPFKPSSDKPVYCRDCFASKRNRETEAYEATKKFAKNESKESPSFVQKDIRPLPQSVSSVSQKQLIDLSSKVDEMASVIKTMNEALKDLKALTENIPAVVASSAVVKTVSVKKLAQEVKASTSSASVQPKKAATVSKVTKKVVVKVSPKKVAVKAVAKKKAVVKVLVKKAVAKKKK